jgi:hypothetical protein
MSKGKQSYWKSARPRGAQSGCPSYKVHPRFLDLHARVVSHETLANPYLTLTSGSTVQSCSWRIKCPHRTGAQRQKPYPNLTSPTRWRTVQNYGEFSPTDVDCHLTLPMGVIYATNNDSTFYWAVYATWPMTCSWPRNDGTPVPKGPARPEALRRCDRQRTQRDRPGPTVDDWRAGYIRRISARFLATEPCGFSANARVFRGRYPVADTARSSGTAAKCLRAGLRRRTRASCRCMTGSPSSAIPP